MRKINQKDTTVLEQYVERATWWDNMAEAAVAVSGSAAQENGLGFQASLRPKINSEK